MKTTVIHHSADYDGIFCREIARKFLPDAELIGWNFGDAPIPFPAEGTVYVMDLSPDCLVPAIPNPPNTDCKSRMVWIDHHKTSIEKWSSDIPGYRIDGVAACRLAWQWFTNGPDRRREPEWDAWHNGQPTKESFVRREVEEPLAVRLAGEYDIWDKRDPDAETFQYGLRCGELSPAHWEELLGPAGDHLVEGFLQEGRAAQRYQQKTDASVINHRGFLVDFDGLKFLALNTARCNSLTFAAKDIPETGHDALMGFYFNGKLWTVSLYHANHRKDLDLSKIAVKHGGGGHKGACGFTVKQTKDFLPLVREG